MGREGRAFTLVVALVLALVALTFGNGARGLFEPSEGRYGSIAAEMARSGDFLVPRLNGVEHFEKPPLALWAMAASLRVFGESEAALRFPGALAALVALAAAFQLAGGARTGRATWAVVLTLSGPLFFAMARAVTTDVYVAAASALALLGAARALDPARTAAARARALTLAAAASALGFLVKGPVIWVLALGPVLLEALWSRDRALLRGVFAWKRVALFLAIVLPWFLAVSWKTPGLLEWFVEKRVAGALMSSEGFHEGPIYYFVPVFLLGFLPAGAIVLSSPRALWKEVLSERGSRLMLCALVVPFAVLSFSASKLFTYLLPLAVPTAVLAAALLERGRGHEAKRGFLAGAAALGLIALGVAVAGQARGRFAALPAGALALFAGAGALAVLGAIGASWLLLRGSIRPGGALLCAAQLTALLLALPAAGLAEEQLVRSGSGRAIARALGELAADGRPILCYRCFVRSLPFYVDRRILLADFYDPDVSYARGLAGVDVCGPEELRSLLGRGPLVLLCRTKQRASLEQEAGPLQLIEEVGHYSICSNLARGPGVLAAGGRSSGGS